MVRVILGLETCDDHLREDILDKRMPRRAVKRAVEALGSVAADVGTDRIGLTFNILVGGPGTMCKTAVDDALATADFALENGRAANLSVDLNLTLITEVPAGYPTSPPTPAVRPRR